jgi:hypothetical protein
MVGIFDVATSSLKGGAIVTGQSSPAAGEADADALIDEALNQATFQAIKEIRSHRPLTGLVQWADEKDAIITIGQTQGAREGMKFVVLRQGRRVGILEITKAQRAASSARLVEGHARTQDAVREIFQIPAKGTALEIPGERAEKKRGKNRLLLALGALLLLAAFTQGSGGKSSVSGLTVATVGNPRDNFLPKTQPYYSPFAVWPGGGEFNPDGAAIACRWKSPSSGKEIISGFEIWRDGQLYWFVAAEGQGGGGNVFTSPTPITGLDVTITLQVDGDGNPTGAPVVDYQMPGPDESAGIPPQASTPTGNGTDELFYHLRGDWYTDTDLDFTPYVGPVDGSRHTYQVRKVTVEPIQNPDGSRDYVHIRGASIGKTYTVTYVASLLLEMPSNGEPIADPTSVTFGFHGALGADDYILQVSRDSQFTTGSTVSDPLTNIDAPHLPAELIMTTKDLTTMLGALPSGTTIFWRVGARYRGDTVMPLPYPLGDAPTSDNYRYVFSETRYVNVQ